MRSSLGIWLEFCDKRAELVELEPTLSPCFFVVLHYKVSRAILFPCCMRISFRTIALSSFIDASYYSSSTLILAVHFTTTILFTSY